MIFGDDKLMLGVGGGSAVGHSVGDRSVWRKVKVEQDMHKHSKVLCDAINLCAMQQVLA